MDTIAFWSTGACFTGHVTENKKQSILYSLVYMEAQGRHKRIITLCTKYIYFTTQIITVAHTRKLRWFPLSKNFIDISGAIPIVPLEVVPSVCGYAILIIIQVIWLLRTPVSPHQCSSVCPQKMTFRNPTQ